MYREYDIGGRNYSETRQNLQRCMVTQHAVLLNTEKGLSGTDNDVYVWLFFFYLSVNPSQFYRLI